jgi:hypothetical protein
VRGSCVGQRRWRMEGDRRKGPGTAVRSSKGVVGGRWKLDGWLLEDGRGGGVGLEGKGFEDATVAQCVTQSREWREKCHELIEVCASWMEDKEEKRRRWGWKYTSFSYFTLHSPRVVPAT